VDALSSTRSKISTPAADCPVVILMRDDDEEPETVPLLTGLALVAKGLAVPIADQVLVLHVPHGN
jgi:hypothetical protein